MQSEFVDQNMTEEEQELITIEKLSQKLELLYKDMEQIRRENILYECYIARNQKDVQQEEEADEKKGKKQKKDKAVDRKSMRLTNEEKYEIAQFESEALKKNIDEGRIKSDGILETLRAILEETDMAITEIRKDAFDFQREILIGGENSRTGKIEAERIVKYFEEKLRQKDALIEKYKAKKATLESQIFKTNNQIIKKEEMGDDLKFIDFHQLQIENKKYVKEIDEKNKKLLQLKIATGKISSILIDEKNTLNEEINHRIRQEAEIAEKTANITRTKISIEKIKEERDQFELKKKLFDQVLLDLETKFGQSKQSELKTMNYVKLKKELAENIYAKRNLQRKIDIAELSYNKAKKALGIK